MVSMEDRSIMEKSSFQIYNEKRLGIRSEELVKELEKDAKDEQEAIEVYDKTLKKTKDANTRKQLEKIKKEEIAHKKYLEEAKNNPNAVYHNPE